MTSIDKMLVLTKGQGHKVKGQDQTYSYEKKLFHLSIMNRSLNLDNTYI